MIDTPKIDSWAWRFTAEYPFYVLYYAVAPEAEAIIARMAQTEHERMIAQHAEAVMRDQQDALRAAESACADKWSGKERRTDDGRLASIGRIREWASAWETGALDYDARLSARLDDAARRRAMA